MAESLNSNELRVAAYLLAAVACAVAGWRERRTPSLRDLDLWPTFWTLSAVFLAGLALARATDFAELLTALARSEARASGWYEARRPLQAVIVGVMSVGWLAAVITAVWRVPERRRRYLPTLIAVFSLICFAAVRLVSFHYADAILYNNPIAGVRIASIIEVVMSAFAGCAATWRAMQPERRSYRRVGARTAETAGTAG